MKYLKLMFIFLMFFPVIVYSGEFSVESGVNWQQFANPEFVETASSNDAFIGSYKPNWKFGPFGTQTIVGSINGRQGTSFIGQSLDINGDPISIQFGPALISDTTDHMGTHWQIMTGISYRTDQITIRFLHLSNGERYLGHDKGPNIGEDMITFGFNF